MSSARIRANGPRIAITMRGDGHYGAPQVMDMLENCACDYILGPPGNRRQGQGAPFLPDPMIAAAGLATRAASPEPDLFSTRGGKSGAASLFSDLLQNGDMSIVVNEYPDERDPPGGRGNYDVPPGDAWRSLAALFDQHEVIIGSLNSPIIDNEKIICVLRKRGSTAAPMPSCQPSRSQPSSSSGSINVS